MKNKLIKLLSILFIFAINLSCAQLGETFIREDKDIVSPNEINYDLELVHENDEIIWAIEFLRTTQLGYCQIRKINSL